MSISTIIKTQAIKTFLNKQKKKPFDEKLSELYTLSDGAPNNQSNSYYFSGHSKDGQSIIVRLGQKGSGNNEVWFGYHDLLNNNFICAHQILQNQTLIETTCLQAGKKWKVQYSGGVIQGTKTPSNIWANLKGTRIIPTVFDGEFTATSNIFEYSKHIDSKAIAKSLAHQQWDKQTFQDFINSQQVYYEQAGRLQGELNLGGKKTEIDMPAIRNRAYGLRDLSHLKSHIAFHILTENDQTISFHLVYSEIGQLQVGFISYGDKNISLNSVNLDETLTDTIPNNFKFLAKFTDNKKLVIQCEKQTEFDFSYDDDGYKITQSIAKFDINGTKARGVIHFGNNMLLK